MNIKKEINAIRRSLFRGLTKNIGLSKTETGFPPTAGVEINRILICRPNHRLGNLLLITPLLQDVIEMFPQAKIDLFVKGGLGPIIFRNYENINHIVQLPKKPFEDFKKYLQGWVFIKKNRYDLVINVIHSSSSGRLSAQFANSKYKFFGDIDPDLQSKYEDYNHNAKFPVYGLRNYLSQLGFERREKRIGSIDMKLSPSELAEGKKRVDSLVDSRKKTICIFTFATDAKCYSVSWWEVFYERLKEEFSEYNILEVLPIENVSQIGFKAISYYSKEIREIASVIANTEIFIGADSGMMHLASSSLTPTVGLFKVTSTNSYEPYDNNSIAINTNDSSIEEWIQAINKILKK
jgi:ADP-heptose:LPS heptosyltransferase